MADEPARGRRRTVAPEPPNDPATHPDAGQEQLFADGVLSGIAREAVRSPADPRLDAHLRFLGLGDPEEAATDRTASVAAAGPATGDADPGSAAVPEPAAALQAEIVHLRATVARLQTEAAQTADRVRQLALVIGVLAIATVVALIVGVVR